MAKLLWLIGVTIASRYWREHCPLQTKRKSVVHLSNYFTGIQNSFWFSVCLSSGILFFDKTLKMQSSRNYWFGSALVELFNLWPVSGDWWVGDKNKFVSLADGSFE